MESLRRKEYRRPTHYPVMSGVIALQCRVGSLLAAEAVLHGVLNKGVLNKGGLNKGDLNKAIGASPLRHGGAYTSRWAPR